MNTLSIAEFCKAKGFTQIVPQVRENSNKYPYITFINAKNEAENIYFSKSAAEAVSVGMPVTKELLAQHQVADTINEAGEVRTKLISNSTRVDISSLL